MPTVNIHKAKTNLSRLVEEAAAGHEVIIAKAGRPVARLVPLAPPPGRRRLGTFKGELDVPANFDAPLPEDILASFEGR